MCVMHVLLSPRPFCLPNFYLPRLPNSCPDALLPKCAFAFSDSEWKKEELDFKTTFVFAWTLTNNNNLQTANQGKPEIRGKTGYFCLQ